MKKRGQNKEQAAKTKFRRSSKWVKFRKHMKENQKTDPITGSRLTPTCSVHHKDLNFERYEDISDKTHFVCLNKTSHDVVHFLWNSHNGWKNALEGLRGILEDMERLNKIESPITIY